ncbi:MAG: hypothetical protein ACLQU6_14410 [Limisphaerales bacterium]
MKKPKPISLARNCSAVLAWGALLLALPHGRAEAGAGEVCHVGTLVGLPPGGPAEDPFYRRYLRAFVENGMGDYMQVAFPGLSAAEREGAFHYLAEHGVHTLASENWPEGKYWYTAADYRRLQEVLGPLYMGAHVGEMDSSGWRPELHLPREVLERPTRKAMHDAFVAWVRERADKFRRERSGPVAHSCGTLFHSVFAEAGIDVLCTETGENTPNMSMAIASNRGAARAYGRRWMIDHSTWWQPRGHAGVLVSPREGHTPWCMFSDLLEAAMGGADCVQNEVQWDAYDLPRLTTGNGDPGPLLPWGVAVKTLYALTHQIGPRGETVTAFGILISPESGWPGVGWRLGDVRGTGLWDGIRHKFMQTRDADLSLKVLDVFYPGFERCGWDPEYPGFLAESPVGTCDLVPDNVPAERYARYQVLVALGYHRMTPEIRGALRQYVERGGVLVCGDTLFLDEQERKAGGPLAEPLIGCVPDLGDDRLVRVYQGVSSLKEVPGYTSAGPTPPKADEGVKLVGREEWQAQWMHPVRLTTGTVVASINDTPYLVENRLGKGRVFYVTALNVVGSDATRRGQEPFLYANILYYFLHSLKDHVGDGVSFSPWTGLTYVLEEKADGAARLMVFNQGDMPYRRDARLRNGRGYKTARVMAQGTWEGYREGGAVKVKTEGGILTWSFSMAPKSFALFELRP